MKMKNKNYKKIFLSFLSFLPKFYSNLAYISSYYQNLNLGKFGQTWASLGKLGKKDMGKKNLYRGFL